MYDVITIRTKFWKNFIEVLRIAEKWDEMGTIGDYEFKFQIFRYGHNNIYIRDNVNHLVKANYYITTCGMMKLYKFEILPL